MYSKEQKLRQEVNDLIGSGLLGGKKRGRKSKGGAIPGGNLFSLFNPLSALGIGAGMSGGGVVNSTRKYKGGGVVNSNRHYEGAGPIGDTFGVPKGVFNWFGLGKKPRKSKGCGVVNSVAKYEGGAGMNPMSMAMSMFNPLAMLGGLGSGQMGGGVVNSQANYEGGGIGDSMGVPRWINWFGIGKKPKTKRAPSARGQKISKLMKEKGMTLGEASKYLKQHGE
jgi:hypothetical protein